MYPFNNDRNIKTLKFHYSLYTDIDQTNSGNFFNDSNKLAELRNVNMYGKCFANIVNNSRSETNPLDIYEDEESITITKDLLLYKEVSEWNLTSLSTNN